LKSRRAPCTFPGPNVLGYVRGVGAAAGISDHVGEEYMYILRKEYFTRYGRAQEAFRTRAKPRGRPVTSDRPPPRRCGQAAWAAAGRPNFCYMGGLCCAIKPKQPMNFQAACAAEGLVDYCAFAQGKIIRFSIALVTCNPKAFVLPFRCKKKKLQRTRCSNARVIRRPAGCYLQQLV
jgi:hypothetical protein